MKKLFVAIIAGIALNVNAQDVPTYHRGQPVSYSDPALSNMVFLNANNGSVNTDLLPLGRQVKMQFTVKNNHALNAVPEGTAMVKVTLGSKFRLADNLNQVILPLNEYFRWSVASAPRDAQQIITGELIKELPANFSGVMTLNLMPWKLGNSTTTAQFMISNDRNPSTVLSDLAQNNNYLSQSYKSIQPSGIKFLMFTALGKSCSVDMNWSIFDENKVATRFVIETSGDGINFTPFKTVNVTNAGSYNYSLNGLDVKSITVRVKIETQDGETIYSTPELVSNLCGGKIEIGLFPNPVPREATELTLIARSGVFNGKYNIRLTDAGGKEVKVLSAEYSNQLQVRVGVGVIPAGAYLLTVTNGEGQATGLPFVKQ